MIAIGNQNDPKELNIMDTKTKRRCSKAGGSIIFPSKLEADIAVARIAGNLARHWRNRYRDAPRTSYQCGNHWHVTSH
jgi:hypothetical protein